MPARFPSAKSPPRRRTLRARANFPQIEPRINPQIVIIVPRKPQRVLSHRFRRQCPYRRLEHRQRSRSQLRRFARLASRFRPLVLAQRARTSIPQKRKRIHRPVPILPLNLHARSRRQMNHHRLRIVRDTRSEIRQRHKFQYRTSATPVIKPRCSNLFVNCRTV
jgi:hypothetical protein